MITTGERLRAIGRAQVRVEGEAELLSHMLKGKFGGREDDTELRVLAAISEEIRVWARRAQTATTLDEVLGSASSADKYIDLADCGGTQREVASGSNSRPHLPGPLRPVGNQRGSIGLQALMAALESIRAEGRTEGLVEGRPQGQAEMLLEQLAIKFGSQDADVQFRVLTAPSYQLHTWIGKILTATTVDEVLS